MTPSVYPSPIRAAPALAALALLGAAPLLNALPPAFDLRSADGTNFVTPVKSQSGGTCWCHGTLAAMESNLKITGRWPGAGETGECNLAEYHLDWWNGFNQANNDDTDPPTGGGLTVHQGGDYRVAAALFTRGEGAVYCPAANDGTESDTPWYAAAPARRSTNYHLYTPRHIEWHTLGPGTQGIEAVKSAIIQDGAVAVCMYWGGGFYQSGTDSHYQPPSDPNDPNHSIAAVGWDDAKATQAPTNGAWLCKNSWGSAWSGDGYFWISYYDKHCGRHPEMGAVSFRQVELDTVGDYYSHDFHGWRDTHAAASAFNAFTARGLERLEAVSFYTATQAVDWTIRVYRRFEGGALLDLQAAQTGRFVCAGFHTAALDSPVVLSPGRPFYIRLDLSAGGQAYDRTSTVDVLLDPAGPASAGAATPGPAPYEAGYFETLGKSLLLEGTEVVSRAEAGQSYYWDGSQWVDLTTDNSTANFCIKGLARPRPPTGILFYLQ